MCDMTDVCDETWKFRRLVEGDGVTEFCLRQYIRHIINSFAIPGLGWARLDLSRTHGNTIISLPFFEICIGFQFVKESSSNWRPWSTNVSTVCVHPTLQRTAYCCLPLVVGSTWDLLADWNCMFQEHELWHLARGISRWQARGLEFSTPWSKRTDSLV